MPDISLIIFFVIMAIVATTGALFPPGDWYETLRKPSWNPPNWLFPVGWTTLYVMIAIAGWLAYQQEPFGLAMAFWGAQAVFNAAWSWLFFGLRRMDLALLDALAMIVCIAGFIVTVMDASPTAALLFVPYLGWVIFAALLNRTVMSLNPAEVRAAR